MEMTKYYKYYRTNLLKSNPSKTKYSYLRCKSCQSNLTLDLRWHGIELTTTKQKNLGLHCIGLQTVLRKMYFHSEHWHIGYWFGNLSKKAKFGELSGRSFSNC